MRLHLPGGRTFWLTFVGMLAIYSVSHFGHGAAVTRAHESAGMGPAAGSSSLTAAVVLAIAVPQRASMEHSPHNNIFASTDWKPPLPPTAPPSAPAPVSPIPLQAPSLPYRFVGMLEGRPKPTAFLAKGEALLIVSAGETIDANYRVDSISSTEIALRYLPLDQIQIIRIQGEL